MAGQLDGGHSGTIDVSVDALAEVMTLARAYDAQTYDGSPEDRLLDVRRRRSPAAADQSIDTVGLELRDAIYRMSADEQAFLVALAWIGRGDFAPAEFDSALVTALERQQHSTADYLLRMSMLAELVEQGASACGIPVSREEAVELYRLNGSSVV